MAIKCPYCSFVLELKGIRPGHFQPKCPRCHEKFGLVIHPDQNMQPTVTAITDHVEPSVASALGLQDKPKHPSPAVAHVTIPPAATNHPIAHRPEKPSPPQVTKHDVVPHDPHLPAPHPKPEPLPSAQPDHGSDVPVGTNLGGYEVVQKLGSGGMGAVYLARQVSLDRHVAIKTLHQDLAKDPQLVSRFTREAYAAAQLTHHNIVQIHDIGQDKDVNFFSMEFVSGKNLGTMLREDGKLDVETGVSYILQAARGLKFAHDHGLIHRDVKPENLMLNDQGIVKVADLGLVKRVGSHETENMQQIQAFSSGVEITQINKSMGTPLYMPPEQAVDAARVDHRADIYSLGCTLYHLVTGRPPFMGKTAMEVITKHQHERVTPPDVVVRDVPAALTPIVTKMLAKHPDDRYPNMKDVITALEGFLGVASTGPFTPKEDQVKVLEYAAQQYSGNLLARLKPKIIMGFYAACGLLALFFAYAANDLVWKFNLAGGMIGLAILTTITYQITVGFMQSSFVFQKMRQLVFGAGITDWMLWIAGSLIFGYVIYQFDLYLPWLIAAIIGVGLAQAMYWTIDTMAARQREHYLQQAESLIKQMRLKGLDENAIRQFVCRFSGKNWEEIFENLFGFEAKLQARQLWGKERGKERPKFAPWREPVIVFIDHRIESRKQLREAKLLARIEQKAMQAKGIEEKLARMQAAKNAQRLINTAEAMKRETVREIAATLAPPSAKVTALPRPMDEKKKEVESSMQPSLAETAASKSAVILQRLASGEGYKSKDIEDHAPGYVRQSYFRRRYGSPLQFATSSLIRVGLALLLLAVYANWWNLNNVGNILEAGQELLSTKQEDVVSRIKNNDTATMSRMINETTGNQVQQKPISIPLVPVSLTKKLVPTTFAVAGVLLLLGGAFRGTLLGLAMYLSAFIAIAGDQFNLPMIGYINWIIAGIAAAGLWVFSIIFLRETND